VTQSNGFDRLSLDNDEHPQLTRRRGSWSVQHIPPIVASVVRGSIEFRNATKGITHPQAASCCNGAPREMSLEQSARRVKTEYHISVGPEEESETLTLNHGVRINLLRWSESGSYRSSVSMKGEAPDCEIVESKGLWICAANAECDYTKGRNRRKLPSLMHLLVHDWDGPQVKNPRPNGSRLSCGALKKNSFLNLRAPAASSAC